MFESVKKKIWYWKKFCRIFTDYNGFRHWFSSMGFFKKISLYTVWKQTVISLFAYFDNYLILIRFLFNWTSAGFLKRLKIYNWKGLPVFQLKLIMHDDLSIKISLFFIISIICSLYFSRKSNHLFEPVKKKMWCW